MDSGPSGLLILDPFLDLKWLDRADTTKELTFESDLEQGSENGGPQTKSGPRVNIVFKVKNIK